MAMARGRKGRKPVRGDDIEATAAQVVDRIAQITGVAPTGSANSGPKPRRRKRVDVLGINAVGDREAWFQTKCAWPQALLADHGISSEYVCVPGNRLADAEGVIESCAPKAVTVRGFALGSDVMEALAERHPDTQFVMVCNSNLSFLMQMPNGLDRARRMIEVARRKRNAWYAVVNAEEVGVLRKLFRTRKVLLVANVLPDPRAMRRRAPRLRGARRRIVNVSLVSAARALKNLPSQVAAAALLARDRRVRLWLALGRKERQDFPTQILSLCDAAREAHRSRFDYRCIPWRDHEEYYRWLASTIDIGLQVSYTESFNYVAFEHMMLGIPVVASPAITYVPMQPNPDAPTDICAAMESVLADYHAGATEAMEIADELATDNNASFVQTIQRLLTR